MGIHQSPVDSPHRGPVTRKCFHLMTSSWCGWMPTSTWNVLCAAKSAGMMATNTSLDLYSAETGYIIRKKYVSAVASCGTTFLCSVGKNNTCETKIKKWIRMKIYELKKLNTCIYSWFHTVKLWHGTFRVKLAKVANQHFTDQFKCRNVDENSFKVMKYDTTLSLRIIIRISFIQLITDQIS